MSVVLITINDLSKISGSGIATREIITQIGAHSAVDVHVICPEPKYSMPNEVKKNIDDFYFLPSETAPGNPVWHLKIELVLLVQLLRLIWHHNPHLVVTRLSQSTLFPAPVCRLFNVHHTLLIRGIINRKDNYSQTKFSRVVEQIVRLNVSLADDIYVAFEAIRDAVDQYRNPEQSPIEVLPNAVNENQFIPTDLSTARSSLNMEYDGFVLGFIGSLAPRQMLSQLLQAVSCVSEVRLLIVGDGEKKLELERLAAELGITNRVEFVGQVPYEDVPLYFAACDVTFGVVNPDRPSNPIKCYESLACERPVITSYAPELEFINQEGGGIVLNDVDIPRITTAIRDLRDTPRSELLQMGEQGRQYVLEHHTWAKIAQEILPKEMTDDNNE